MKGNLYFKDDVKGITILERNTLCWRIFIDKTSTGFHFDLPFKVNEAVKAEILKEEIPGFVKDHRVDNKRWIDFQDQNFKYSYYFEGNELLQVKIESKLNTERTGQETK